MEQINNLKKCSDSIKRLLGIWHLRGIQVNTVRKLAIK